MLWESNRALRPVIVRIKQTKIVTFVTHLSHLPNNAIQFCVCIRTYQPPSTSENIATLSQQPRMITENFQNHSYLWHPPSKAALLAHHIHRTTPGALSPSLPIQFPSICISFKRHTFSFFPLRVILLNYFVQLHKDNSVLFVISLAPCGSAFVHVYDDLLMLFSCLKFNSSPDMSLSGLFGSNSNLKKITGFEIK